jgi:hypothetical protein
MTETCRRWGAEASFCTAYVGVCIVLKKSLAAVGVAGLLVFGGSATAFAEAPSSPVAVTVVAAGSDTVTDSAEMGMDAPIAVVWLGIGVIGIGGIAIAAALARRRANQG